MTHKPVLETDQTQCFDGDGHEIECRGSLQDGASVSEPVDSGRRFHVMEDFLEDRWTGLTWPLSANLTEFPLSWDEAFDFVDAMNQSKRFGRADWRMPS